MSDIPPNHPDNEGTFEPGNYSDDSIQSAHSHQVSREKSEPIEGLAPVPMFLIFLFSVLMFWGGIYVQRYSGDFRSDVFDHNWKPTAATNKAEKPFDPIAEGAKLYSRACQQCHQAKGVGVPSVYPPLDDSEWVEGDARRLAKLVMMGMSGPITVRGNPYNGNMPPHAHWKDRQIAAVLTYIRQSWSNQSEPITEAFVAEIRKELGNRTKPWKPEELLAEHPW